MAGLQWQLQPIENEDSAILAELSGAIDGNTVPSFQQMLEEIKGKGVRRLVLDMSKIKYVNSTGLGSLVKYADSFKSSGGGMALIKVPAKVKIVIEMLGLNAFFDICPGLPEALAALEKTGAGGGGGGQKPPAGSTKPPLATSGTTTRPPAPGGAPPAGGRQPPATGKPAPTAAPAAPAAAPAGGAGFPVVMACQLCGVQVEFRNAGNWKCPRCYALAMVRGDGNVTFQAQTKPATIAVSLTASGECGEGLLHFVTSVCGTAFNGNNLESVRIAVHELASVMQSSIYADNPNGVYHVAIDRQPGRVQIRVSDSGATIDVAHAREYFPRASSQMDEFECRPHPSGAGNVIRMAKNG